MRQLINTLIAFTVFFGSCYAASPAYEERISFQPHIDILSYEPHWAPPEFSHSTQFGGYYFEANRAGRTATSDDYFAHTPVGPIMALWTVTRYLEETRPKRVECAREPAYPSLYGKSKEEYEVAINNFVKPFNEYSQCRRTLFKQFEDEETRTTYYARSPNHYKIVFPPERKEHVFYKIEGVFGGLGSVPFEALTEKQKQQKDTLIPSPCLYAKRSEAEYNCFRLSDNEDSFFYKIRSAFTLKHENGHRSLQFPPPLTDEPQGLNEIKAIEITDKQKAYLLKRCNEEVFSCFLDDKTPELTEKQKQYIKETSWNIDTDMKARKAFLKLMK